MAEDDDPQKRVTVGLAEEDPQPGTLIGEFRVEGKLGQGGMGSVHSAVHPLLGKRAAIKVISRRLCADLHAVERFIQEARAVHHIGHPNIVDTFAFGKLPDGRVYFMMEWLQGEPLATRIAAGPLPLRSTIEILLQLCDALEAAHDNGVIHRDLKPDNIFVVETRDRPFVKVLDFGLAKLADADVTLPKSRSRSGVAMGTAGYMSPEQARCKPVDGRTDIYALGAMAYQMVLGKLPFTGESAIDILAQHLAEPVPMPSELWPEIPQPLDQVLVKMLEKEAAKRPPLSEVRKVLVSLRDGELPDRRARPRRMVGWALAAAGALLVLGGGVWLLAREKPQPEVVKEAPATKEMPPAPKEVAPPPATQPAPAAKEMPPAAKELRPSKRTRKPAQQKGDYTLDPFE